VPALLATVTQAFLDPAFETLHFDAKKKEQHLGLDLPVLAL
jgi:hypothetical protein